MAAQNTTNVEEVLPNDEDLGRRNFRWRQLIKKYEEGTVKEAEHEMEIDMAMDMLDQEMSNESTVSDVEESSSKTGSAEENQEDIKRQLQVAIPMRKRAWEVNGLKEIMDDQEFRMLSHEKVENWLRNHMDSITGHYNVRYQTQQVTTVTETCMDADADSLYSVDTAQYIRSNKQISNKVKVTTMIKQYAVTSSIRHERVNSLGDISDGHSHLNGRHRLSLPQLGRLQSKSDGSYDVMKHIGTVPVQRPPAPVERIHRHHRPPPLDAPNPARRTRKKVFKKTLPRKRPTAASASVPGAYQGLPVTSPPSRFDQADVYEQALEEVGRLKKAKVRRTPIRRVTRKYANRGYFSSSSSDGDDRLDDSDEVFPVVTPRDKSALMASRKNLFHQSIDTRPASSTASVRVVQRGVASPKASPPRPIKTSPTEREIVEPFQSITLSASKRKRSKPAGPEQSASDGTQQPNAQERSKKRVGIQADGCYHDEGLVIYRPKTIQPHLSASERILLRMEDLTLDGVRKERHMVKFRDFNYRIHPNSTVCFYPSESESDENLEPPPGDRLSRVRNSETENSCDDEDDDPLVTFQPRKTKLLNVVEVPYRRPIS